MKEAANIITEEEKKAYLDPEKAEQQRQEGNEHFKNGNNNICNILIICRHFPK